VSIQDQVERIKQLALAHAELAPLYARLTQFERDTLEAERLTGHPFLRGRTIIEQTRAQLERELAALAGMSA
jgi:hypothetical protein